jgi:hypothetical protein
MATPNPTDQYTRFMVGMFDERDQQGIPTAFQSFFGNNAASETVFEPDAGTIEIDIIRANGERLAPLVHRGQSSKDVSRGKNLTDEEFSNFVRKWPLIEKEGNINSQQLLNRLAGDNAFQRRSKLDKNRQLARKIHFSQIRESVRTCELLASQSILEGVQDAILDTSNTALQYDFRRKSTHNVSVEEYWDGESAAIMDDLDAACDLSEADAYVTPDFLGLGDKAIAALIRDTEMQTLADNRRYKIIQVSQNNPVPTEYAKYIKAGWTARGLLMTLSGRELWMFTNNQRYTNDSGASTRYMPSDKAFLLNTNARLDKYFGPRDSFDPTPAEATWMQQMFGFSVNSAPIPQNVAVTGVIDPRMFYFDGYMGKGRKTQTLRAQCAPIFPTTQTDTIIVLSDLITP